MIQEGWICPRCGKVNAPWMPNCDCKSGGSNTPPKIGAPYYEGPQITCKDNELPDQRKDGFDFGNLHSGQVYINKSGTVCRLC